MFSFFIKRWIFFYIFILLIFFIFLREERIHSQLSELNYARKADQVISSKLRNNIQPSAHALKQGIGYYEMIINVLGPWGYAYSKQGFCYYYLGDFEKALAMYDKAIELNPWDYWNYWDQAVIHWKRQKDEKAEEFFKKAIDTVPDTLHFYTKFAKNENFRSFFGEQIVQNSILFLIVRAQADQIFAMEKLGQIFLKRGEKKAAQIMFASAQKITNNQKNKRSVAIVALHGLSVLARNHNGEPQLHFNRPCFDEFFLNLAVRERMRR